MRPTSAAFKANAREALADAPLQDALSKLGGAFPARRRAAIEGLPEFDALRDRAVEIKNDVIANLDYYLEVFEDAVTASGGHVHWCRTPEEARATVLKLCRDVGARTVTKGKTMIGEEIAINPFLEAHGIAPVETDLGEYIIQLAGEAPSHIIAPAIHKTKDQVSDLFLEHHAALGKTVRQTEGEALVAEAREVLRPRYAEADVGITGANFLIVETGSSVIVTNEGNGDLTQTLPKVHIVLASLEKIVPTLEDAATLLRVLARSATGQEASVYTTFSTGPRRPGDADGPEAYHIVLLDNGRSDLIGSPLQDILRCIRCGACLNDCPVYKAVGGHAYGWVYSGPVGAVLTPALIGIEEARHLPSATPFCGRCEAVCPMRIPLPSLMRHWRERAYAQGLAGWRETMALRLWAWFARRPALYRIAARFAANWLAGRARGRGVVRGLPFVGGWTAARDFPAPQGGTFQDQWRARRAVR
jgi:L-lactate dehydrogenase complex protein LldF